MEKWLLDQSTGVVICVTVMYYGGKGIAAFYRDWMGKDSFAKDFFVQHKRIADAGDAQVTLGEKLVDALEGLETKVTTLSLKVEQVESGVDKLTHEVKNHPPTRMKDRV